MFEDLRWRITLLFVALSVVIYITLTLFGLKIFERGQTLAIDKQLKVVASEIGHAIDLENDTPKFRDWVRIVRTEPPRSLATIQLFDNSGRLLEHYGPTGIKRLFRTTEEARIVDKSFRVLCSPLMHDNTLKGYVQIQLPTTERDQAIQELIFDACITGILFLCALSVTSYWVAKKVTQPIQDSVQILRSFVADASHELNTPLTILRARTESLQNKLSKAGIEEEDLSIAVKSLERLDKVVSDLLLLSEVEDPLSGLNKTPIEVSNLLSDVVEEVRTRFQAKEIELNLVCDQGAYAMAHEEALRRLFSNLLENALRYTDAKGAVNVSLNTSEREVRIAIRDSGIGIPPESLPRIFDRFFRVDQSRSRESGGNGLGLAIVKAIAEAHRGTIDVKSDIGVGSSFTLTMPRIDQSKLKS